MNSRLLRIEVIYALPDQAVRWKVLLPPGSTIADAIGATGLPLKCPDIEFPRTGVGVFGRLAALDRRLVDGDRVELYRPLASEPDESRRRRADQVKRSSGAR